MEPDSARGGYPGETADDELPPLRRTGSTGSSLSSGARGAVGSFAAGPLEHLARVLAADEDTQLRLLEVQGIRDHEFIAQLRRSCELCQRAALLYPRNSELAISFNGGKDACVVLYLWLAAAAAAEFSKGEGSAPVAPTQEAVADPPTPSPREGSGTSGRGQTVIFFDSPQEFQMVRLFVAWVVRSLGLHQVKVESCSFKRGMGDLVDDGLRAVVMGQRRGDPWTEKVNVFSPSDRGWPAFMRVNPIIEWKYSHIWTFLRKFELPYCNLYDEGYTSIGSVENTVRNPALLRPDGSYRPAYELEDASLERTGRGPAAKAAKSGPEAAKADDQDFSQRLEKANSPTLRAFKSALCVTPPRTAGVVIIGNEILSGKIQDANAHYVCKELRSKGVFVKSTEVVPDEAEAIARSVRRMSDRCDFVFTSGGLGPTHDDVSMAGVAAAFDVDMVCDERFRKMLEAHFGADKGSAATTDTEPSGADAPGAVEARGRQAACRKMSSVPEGATVEWPADGNPWPLVSMRNVYIFAGNPSTFCLMFQRAASDGRFEGPQQLQSHLLWLDAAEADVLDALQRTVDSFPLVEIGSYPSTASSPGVRRLCVTLEAFDAADLQAARQHMVAALASGVLVAEEGAGGPGGGSSECELPAMAA